MAPDPSSVPTITNRFEDRGSTRATANTRRRVTLPHIAGLDGLRGIAVIAVLAFHSDYGFARGGFLGVSLFFTLSGFLITSLLLAEWHDYGNIDLRSFWWRRVRRLLPAALVALLLVVLFAAFAATATQRAGLEGDLRGALLYVANWHALSADHSYATLFSDPSPALHFWSLAIEEQFYLVFPLLVAGVFAFTRASRKIFGWILGLLVAGSLVMQLLAASHDRSYYGTDTRASEFLVGGLLALAMTGTWTARSTWLRRRAIAVVGVVALVASLWTWSQVGLSAEWLYEGGFLLVGVFSCALIAAVMVPGPVRSIMSTAPLCAVGTVSYGLYLYHWPIFLWLSPSRTGLDDVPLLVVRIGVTAIVAVLSYRLVELPIRTGRAFARPRAFWPAVVAVAAGLVLFSLVVPVPRGSQLITSDDFAAASKLVGIKSDAASRAPTAATKDALRVFVVGDSTGLLFSAGLQEWGTATGKVTVASDAFLNCPLARGGRFRHGSDESGTPVDDYCNTISDHWPADIATFQPDVIVVMGGVTSLMDRSPDGSSDWYTLGEPAWDPYFWSELNRDADLLTVPDVPILWFDQPLLQRDGGTSTGLVDDWAEPARAAAYNQFVARLDKERPNVTRFRWAHYLNSMPLATWLQYVPDGIHVEAAAVTRLVREQRLWEVFHAAYVASEAGVSKSEGSRP